MRKALLIRVLQLLLIHLTLLTNVQTQSVSANGNIFYIRNTDAFGTINHLLDPAFGSGAYIISNYSINPATLISNSTSIIYLDGSNTVNPGAMANFLNTNRSALETWVYNGGRLFLNAAPNEGSNINFGFGGVTLNFSTTYSYATGSASIAAGQTAHPIFNEPFTPTGTSWTGGAFGHATVSGGSITPLIIGTIYNAGTGIVLAELKYGAGLVLFGGMTFSAEWAHAPQPEAANLKKNILYYLKSFVGQSADSDNDGIVDTEDNCPLEANPGQEDLDGDNEGDVCDLDDDGDGVADAVDNCPTVANTDQNNNDGDIQGDICDPDDDNDLVLDGADCAPLDATRWRSETLYIDVDGDGYTAGTATVCYGSTIQTGYSATSSGTDNCDSDAKIYPGSTPPSITVPVGGSTVALGTTTAFTYTLNGSNSVWSWSVIFYDATGTAQSIITKGGTINATAQGSILVTWPTDMPRVYKIVATYTGSCPSIDPVEIYVAVYDPNGSFVTGGGWFDSKAGYYTADPAATGKANFGFVAKYKKGSDVPDGTTEFQFSAGNLNFRSTAYDRASLVVGGPKATYKGVGTINGAGSYMFMLSAVDGQVTGGGGLDKVRMKIVDANGTTIYDNQTGILDENAEPSTVIGGGSIVIHTPTKGKTTTTTSAEANIREEVYTGKFVVSAMPNPTQGYFTLRTQSSSMQQLQVRVLDLIGRVVENRSNIAPNSNVAFGSNYRPGVYFFEVVQGTEKQVLKLIKH